MKADRIDTEVTHWFCEKCGASWHESWTGHTHCGQPVVAHHFIREDVVEAAAQLRERAAHREGVKDGWNA